ncbi:MAG: PepSY-like domain-containing protein [Prevotellaceae bacterium]|jgi:hypothetical protein|nr:PepSY-like domain-containing protein [Prevotellaceae bacterium]
MNLFKLSGIVIAGCFFFAQTVAAQSNPAISKEYSDETVARMIRQYRMSGARDVMPPAALAAKFKSDFPKAYDAEWEVADSIYEVEFDLKFRDCEAYYDARGNLLMVVEEIYRSELPATVKNVAKAKYPGYSFEDIDRIRRGTEVFYKIEMERRDAEVKLLIKADGAVMEEKTDD